MRFPANWAAIDYLASGSPRQRAAYAALQEIALFDHLAPFQPILVGTIPLGIDLPASDLDVVCAVADFPAFRALLVAHFGALPGFALSERERGGLPTLVCRFAAGPFPVELFAQDRPTTSMNGYQHMLVEAHLLALAGPEAAAAIRSLKAAGLKTEPAFAHYFGLAGEPYQALLDLYPPDEATLRQVVAGRAKGAVARPPEV